METAIPIINGRVLMSDANHFRNVVELNRYTREDDQPDINLARIEHGLVKSAFIDAGIDVIQRKSPANCQDGIYTANWAFCLGDKAVMARLPNVRRGEESRAARILTSLGKTIIRPPRNLRYSGQGDTLLCGDTIFVGSRYRTDPEMADFLEDQFADRRIVRIQTVPAIDNGQEAINQVSGWPDSDFYDIDLAMGIVEPGLIAWCPEAFTPESQAAIGALTDIDKIEISYKEATENFASNFVSTGKRIIMGNAPNLASALHARGKETTILETKQINKAGGFIRCISLTLDNE